MTTIVIIHPGEMGVSVAASAIQSGHRVLWSGHSRSEKTRQRAEAHKLIEVSSLTELCKQSEVILSVCPPHAAEDVADLVVEQNFKGLYLDANAISPQRTIQLGHQLEKHGINFVDGGIIGGPAWKPGETRLYLAGKDAQVIADCFANGLLETQIIRDEIGKASALKMCYAAYSKGTTALLAAILATAESLGVRDDLYTQWELDEPGFTNQVNGRVKRVTSKAWRFEGEMHEIAETFYKSGLPEGFHKAAAEVYRRMAGFKDADEVPVLEDVLSALVK